MSWIERLIKWAPNVAAGFIGVAQPILLFVKEVGIVTLRVIAPIIPGDKDDKAIQMIVNVAQKLYDVLEKVKSFFLNITSPSK